MNITFLSENKTYKSKCFAEFGLSIYIEDRGRKILFDTGASDLFADNAARLSVALEDAEALVISHGHYDHTGGVPLFCRLNRDAPVYIHRNAFRNFYGSEGDVIDDYPCGVMWDRETLLGRLRLTDGPLWLTDDMVISGTIPDVKEFAPAERFYIRRDDGSFVPDDMSHEQFLAIRRPGKGVTLFSGCSHKGIVAALEYAKTLFPGDRVTQVVAGMHLGGASDKMRRSVAEKLAGADLELAMPMHCTGIPALLVLKSVLGDKCVVASAGDRFEL